ncbi:MAG: hypothetical protein ABSC53_08025 [Bacteroidota bacterium]
MCLVVFRSTEKAGTITLKASADGLDAMTIIMNSKYE